MVQAKRGLWLRLREYHFDHIVPPNLLDHVVETFGGVDASTKAFAHKLTRKLDWTTEFALKAIAEYKKFVYLGVTGDFSVTPSKVIDQVWHEHLLFTRAYASFCQEILGKNFNHNPELVPNDDQTGTFQAQYLETLELYRSEFNTEPPADIWAVPKFKSKTKDNYESRKKPREEAVSSIDDNLPLYMMFFNEHPNSGSYPEFEGFEGGRSGGAGAGATWNESHHDSSHGHTDATSDSGSHGGSDASGSDGGAGPSSCGGGGSSCSSGCGGGGCGGD